MISLFFPFPRPHHLIFMSSERELLMLVMLFHLLLQVSHDEISLTSWAENIQSFFLFQAAMLTHLLLVLLVLANWLHEFSSLASCISTDSFLPSEQQTNSCLGLLFTNNLFIEIYSSCPGCFFLIVCHTALFWFCPTFILVPSFCALILHFRVGFLLVLRTVKSLWYRVMRR